MRDISSVLDLGNDSAAGNESVEEGAAANMVGREIQSFAGK